MSSRKELILNAIINGETVNIKARTRAEEYLIKCLGKSCDGLE